MSEIINIIIVLIGFLIMSIGVVLIYDARKITNKWFSFGDKNDGAKVLKIVGFVVSVIGGIIVIITIA